MFQAIRSSWLSVKAKISRYLGTKDPAVEEITKLVAPQGSYAHESCLTTVDPCTETGIGIEEAGATIVVEEKYNPWHFSPREKGGLAYATVLGLLAATLSLPNGPTPPTGYFSAICAFSIQLFIGYQTFLSMLLTFQRLLTPRLTPYYFLSIVIAITSFVSATLATLSYILTARTTAESVAKWLGWSPVGFEKYVFLLPLAANWFIPRLAGTAELLFDVLYQNISPDHRALRQYRTHTLHYFICPEANSSFDAGGADRLIQDPPNFYAGYPDRCLMDHIGHQAHSFQTIIREYKTEITLVCSLLLMYGSQAVMMPVWIASVKEGLGDLEKHLGNWLGNEVWDFMQTDAFIYATAIATQLPFLNAAYKLPSQVVEQYKLMPAIKGCLLKRTPCIPGLETLSKIAFWLLSACLVYRLFQSGAGLQKAAEAQSANIDVPLAWWSWLLAWPLTTQLGKASNMIPVKIAGGFANAFNFYTGMVAILSGFRRAHASPVGAIAYRWHEYLTGLANQTGPREADSAQAMNPVNNAALIESLRTSQPAAAQTLSKLLQRQSEKGNGLGDYSTNQESDAEAPASQLSPGHLLIN